jgi:hypothetical protein
LRAATAAKAAEQAERANGKHANGAAAAGEGGRRGARQQAGARHTIQLVGACHEGPVRRGLSGGSVMHAKPVALLHETAGSCMNLAKSHPGTLVG